MLLLSVSLVVFTQRVQHPHHNVVVDLEPHNILSGHEITLLERSLKMRPYPDVLLAPPNEKEALPHLACDQEL